jgi:hypothetical protein
VHPVIAISGSTKNRVPVPAVTPVPQWRGGVDLSGQWVGEMTGTNAGVFSLALQQIGPLLSGKLAAFEPRVGVYAYELTGQVFPTAAFSLKPITPSTEQVRFGDIAATFTSDFRKGSVSGHWRSTVGTWGTFSMWREGARQIGIVPSKAVQPIQNVFIVHGHDHSAKDVVQAFFAEVQLKTTILSDVPNLGRALVDKFEQTAAFAQFAAVILTPDDLGRAKKDCDLRERARQNVWLELGYFYARLGRHRVCVLKKGDVEIPSDIFGVGYVEMDDAGRWRSDMAKELFALGVPLSLESFRT